MKEMYLDSGGFNLWAASHGEGTPVVLCSGGPGCCDYLAPVADLLEGVATVFRFEARGCGRSEKALTYSVETSLTDLEAVRVHFDIGKWIVVGHSWGADLALLYALRYPERLLGFVCLAGGRVHNDREWHRVYQRNRDAGLESSLEFDYPPNLDVNAQVNTSWKAYIQQPTLLRNLSRLEVPALFIYGAKDVRPSWPVEQVAQLLPQGKLHVLEADHYLWQGEPEQLKEHLRAFVQTCDL